MQITSWRNSAALLAALALGACSDTGPGTTGSLSVTMQQTSQIFAQVAPTLVADLAGGEAVAVAVAPDTVASLTVRVTRIDVLSEGDSAAADSSGAWQSLDLSAPVLVDLATLPVEGSSPLVIASGRLPVGAYANVRLFVDSAAMTFKGPLSLGAGASFDAGTVYQVTIPSAAQTGLKTDASFTVDADSTGTANDVNLLFSPSSTFQNISVTGNATVTLAPVIRGGGQG